MASGDSGQIRIDGTMPLQVVVQGDGEAERRLGKVQEAVERVSSVFNKMSSGLDFSKYFKTAESSLKGVGDALKRVSEAGGEAGGAVNASRRDIEALLKSVNAFKASAILNGEDPGKIFQVFGQELSDAVAVAEKRLPRIAQAFSVDEFKAAFIALGDAVELFGHNYDSIISKLNQASPGEYIRMVDEIRAKNAELESDVRQLKAELESIGAGNGSQLSKQIRDLQSQITAIRNNAVREFSEFLVGNELSPDDYHFGELFEQIRNGSLTAREAIAQCKAEFSHLFDGSTDGLAQQLVARFEEAAQKIEALRTQIVQMRRDLANAGIGTSGGGMADEVNAETEALSREGEAVENVKKNAEGLGETAEIIRRLAEYLSVAGVGANAREVASSVSMMAESLKQLGDTDESKLSSIASALYSIQSMNGFSANSKALASLTQLLSDLSGIEHSGTSVLASLSSMNLANLQNLKVSKAALENLKNNLPDIGRTNVAAIKQLVELPWSNLSGLSVDKKSIDSLKGLADSFKLDKLNVALDETGLSSLSKSIEDAIQRASQNIKLTIDNVELSAAAQKKIAEAASAAQTGGSGRSGNNNGGNSNALKAEQQALNNLISLYQQYYALESKKISAVNKGDIDNADVYRARANAIWEEIARVEELNPKLAELAGQHEKVTEAVRKWQAAVNSGQARSDSNMARRVQEEAKALEEYQKQIDRLGTAGTGGSSIKFSGDTAALAQYEAELQELQNRFQQIATAAETEKSAAVAAFEEQRQKVEDLRTSLNSMASSAKEAATLSQQYATFRNQLQAFTVANPKAYNLNKAEIDSWFAAIDSGANQSSTALQAMKLRFTEINGEMRTMGTQGKTVFQQLKAGWQKFGGWSIVTKSFTKIISTMKQAVTAVKEVDAAMTELRKVTDLTETQYDSLYNKMVGMSGQVGSKLSDVISSVGDFSRLGYNAAEALSLSEAALTYFNVGDQLENINEATESLISTMKAFGIEANDAMSIVDMFNEVKVTCLHI